jgi:hypothetical protein
METLKKPVTELDAMSKALAAEQATLQATVSKPPCSRHGFYKLITLALAFKVNYRMSVK